MALRPRSYCKLANPPPAADDKCTEQFGLEVSSNIRAAALQIFFDKKYSDSFIITRDSITIPVHKCVLGAWSPYFYAVFSSGCRESLTNCLRFSDLTFDQLMPILYQLYGKELDITPENVVNLLIIAGRLRVKFLIKKYVSFISAKTVPSNCIGIWLFAEAYWFPELINHALSFIKENFMEVSSTDEFRDLSYGNLFLLLSNAELCVKSEMHVMAAICKWAFQDMSSRKEQARLLMTTIRFQYPQERNFDESILDPYKNACNELIREFFALANDYRCGFHLEEGLPPRMPHEIVFVIGGWSGKEPKNSIEIYNPITRQWCMSSLSMPEQRIYYAAVELNNIIYIMGGFDNIHRGLNSVWSFDPLEERWEKRAPMLQKRCYASAVVLEGMIYVMGGYDESSPRPVPVNPNQNMVGTRFKSVERYCPEQNRWTKCTDMMLTRSDGAAVAMHSSIFCVGGFTGEVIHKSVEWCEVGAMGGLGEWFFAAPMNIARSGVSCEVIDDYIFAVGGFNGEHQLDSIERYNGYFNIWEVITRMENPRSNMGLVRVDTRLLIVGGYGNEYTTPLCEEFSPATRHFTTVDNLPLKEGCSGIKLVATRGFHISRRYTC